MQKINRCFILENGEYIEVPAERVLDNGEYREEFHGRYFFPFDDALLEMSKKDRRYFFSCQEAMQDIIKQPKKKVKREKKYLVLSIEELVEDSGEENLHLDFLEDPNSNVANQIEKEILLETIRKHRQKLSATENEVLENYYSQGMSDKEIGDKLGKSERTINNWRRAALGKLLNFLK